MNIVSKQSEWDYELYPVDEEEIGNLPYINIDTVGGEQFLVNYYVINRNTGYIYDLRSAGGSYLSFAAQKEQDITVRISAGKGHVTFGGHHSWGQQYALDIPIGKYIRIKRLNGDD